jgi:hypothetical protein
VLLGLLQNGRVGGGDFEQARAGYLLAKLNIGQDPASWIEWLTP